MVIVYLKIFYQMEFMVSSSQQSNEVPLKLSQIGPLRFLLLGEGVEYFL